MKKKHNEITEKETQDMINWLNGLTAKESAQLGNDLITGLFKENDKIFRKINGKKGS